MAQKNREILIQQQKWNKKVTKFNKNEAKNELTYKIRIWPHKISNIFLMCERNQKRSV